MDDDDADDIYLQLDEFVDGMIQLAYHVAPPGLLPSERLAHSLVAHLCVNKKNVVYLYMLVYPR